MIFQGEVLSVGTLLQRAKAAPDTANVSGTHSLLHSAAGNAAACIDLLFQGEGLAACWRHGILQTVDDYNSLLKRGGVEQASQMFEQEPAATGAPELDAAFAALADHLAHRDGWDTPSWAMNPSRVVQEWYATTPSIFRAEAQKESPFAFRSRGIFITEQALARA